MFHHTVTGRARLRSCVARRYTGQNFDAEFIQTMYQVCRHYIGERQSVSLEDMGDYVREKVPAAALLSHPTPCSCVCGGEAVPVHQPSRGDSRVRLW